MNPKFIPLKIVAKAAYLIGMLLLFNFFFGLIFFRFVYWILLGAVLLFFLSIVLSLGKNMLFNKSKDSETNTRMRGDVIDVEAEVFDEGQDKN